jgi:hypothetical protein
MSKAELEYKEKGSPEMYPGCLLLFVLLFGLLIASTVVNGLSVSENKPSPPPVINRVKPSYSSQNLLTDLVMSYPRTLLRIASLVERGEVTEEKRVRELVAKEVGEARKAFSDYLTEQTGQYVTDEGTIFAPQEYGKTLREIVSQSR